MEAMRSGDETREGIAMSINSAPSGAFANGITCLALDVEAKEEILLPNSKDEEESVG